mmetsp:Transcript_9473/g.27203  ORF Transcript_9473/g.27203 Transcript_9473/m.27203 type:complete len:164 (-) Transcript_9473:144-635(-)
MCCCPRIWLPLILFATDGTFVGREDESSKKPSRTWLALGALLLTAVVAVSMIVSLGHAEPVHRPMLLQKARQQMLSWNGFTLEMQQEADKALRLCAVGLMGKKNQEKPHGCVKHVVPTDTSSWTHSEAGQNEWEETQNVLSQQVSVAPLGPDIGTPGDFGDRR